MRAYKVSTGVYYHTRGIYRCIIVYVVSKCSKFGL